MAERCVYAPQFILCIQEVGYGLSCPDLDEEVILECKGLFTTVEMKITSF